jgi:predicted metal-dependent hydrolase
MRLSGRDFFGAASSTPQPLPMRRQLKWDFSDITPVFVEGDILVSYGWAALSIFAPASERFFISALRPLIDSVDDPKLRQDIEDMLAQEAMHAAAHARFNRALAKIGYPVDRTAPHIEKMLEWFSNNCSRMELVGIVAFGEHAIYSLAKTFLDDPSIGADMAPAFRRLLEYHLVEEVEHAAVAQDVLRYFMCGNDYADRARVAAMAMRKVLPVLHAIMNELVMHGPEQITANNWARLSHYGLVSPGILLPMGQRMAAYLHPNFSSHGDVSSVAGLPPWLAPSAVLPEPRTGP